MLAIEDSRQVNIKQKGGYTSLPHASKTIGANSSHQLGRLPTLGLSKYQAADFGDETRNPFYVQPVTEKMLVVRELEREVRDLNKFEKDALKVHQKTIQTRQERTGAIKDVSSIPGKKWEPTNGELKRLKEIMPSVAFPAKKKDEKRKSQNTQQDEDRDQAGNKQKINIFELEDSKMLKHEALARMN